MGRVASHRNPFMSLNCVGGPALFGQIEVTGDSTVHFTTLPVSSVTSMDMSACGFANLN